MSPFHDGTRNERGVDPARARVEFTLLCAGSVEAPERIFAGTGGWKRVKVPALFGLIEHPERGPILFDTGYSTHFYEATRKLPYKLYSLLTPAAVTREEDAASQLRRRGLDPERVGWIIISHFDPDHIGGLKDFPNARVVCSWQAWEGVAGKTGLKAFASRLLPGLLPEDLAARLLLLSDPAGPSVGPFPHSLDLFGDHSVCLVHLPGHSPGMIGAFVASESGATIFLCADACWSLKAIAGGHKLLSVHRLIAVNRPEQDKTYVRLHRLQVELPEVKIIPSHCPETAARWLRRSWA